ncbi:Uncharacterized protein TCM_037887 [Theobroma cacao]|uniref:Transmembrane protein n=1 Tax=Theobroma cacao TaxID=3641 RepID=A0A061GN36_THECC|nr:Uncharacterized protein TCM_037887 [Theobroma cacao]
MAFVLSSLCFLFLTIMLPFSLKKNNLHFFLALFLLSAPFAGDGMQDLADRLSIPLLKFPFFLSAPAVAPLSLVSRQPPLLSPFLRSVPLLLAPDPSLSLARRHFQIWCRASRRSSLWCRASRRSSLSFSVRRSFPSRQIFTVAAPFPFLLRFLLWVFGVAAAPFPLLLRFLLWIFLAPPFVARIPLPFIPDFWALEGALHYPARREKFASGR